MKLDIKPLAFAISVLPSQITFATDLTVEVVGLKNDQGNIHVALFNTKKDFPYQKAIFLEKEVTINNNYSFCIFTNLKPGAYAIAAYHDENNNNEFDQNFLGFPLESFGFSNQAKVFLGPPSFDDAKFFILDKNITVKIDFDY